MNKVYVFKNEKFLAHSLIFSSLEDYKAKFCSLNSHNEQQITVLAFSQEDLDKIEQIKSQSNFSRFENKNGKMQLISTMKVDVDSQPSDVVLEEFSPTLSA